MQKQGDIENTAQNILEARLQYPDESFAELYEPDKMPDDLLSAHKANDAACPMVPHVKPHHFDYTSDEKPHLSKQMGFT